MYAYAAHGTVQPRFRHCAHAIRVVITKKGGEEAAAVFDFISMASVSSERKCTYDCVVH